LGDRRNDGESNSNSGAERAKWPNPGSKNPNIKMQDVYKLPQIYNLLK